MTDKMLSALVWTRMEVIFKEAEEITANMAELERDLALCKHRWAELQEAYIELAKVYERVKPKDADAVRVLPSPGRPGPTEFVELVLQQAAAVGKRFSRDEIVNFLREAIEQHNVASSTTDPAKLSASVIGGLVKRGRIADTPDGYIELKKIDEETPNWKLSSRLVERST